ncbi:MAG: hydantoinase B/oxoprolinase family protein [Chloroflexaceae bacterium]|nr:hydantoinase B/oxoprolinase family protein [Chloroflexaceae bacterium]NJO06647.1 hydantoinase B/oxoprolinase family protein [Chloroflexaceae bacterium]
MTTVDPISLEVFRHRCAAIAEEMGAALGRTAFSANIKERRDFSCALFDATGTMIAQAAHIPAHLGAMPRSVEAALQRHHLQPGDVVILNDPYRGGSHLPDITMVSPVHTTEGVRVGYVASRAHHADVGGMTPGSMPMSTELYQEGLIIPPVLIQQGGQLNGALVDMICRNSRTPDERSGDLSAQLACHALGATRLLDLVAQQGLERVHEHMQALLEYGERHVRALLASLPDGTYCFEDVMDDDGHGSDPLPIRVTLRIAGDTAVVDFTGTAPQVNGPINAPLAVAESAVQYCFRCLSSDDMPEAAFGALVTRADSPLKVVVPEGSLINPRPPAAVAGGNVETAQRVVDVVFGALAQAVPDRIPAASAGTMNNWTFGGLDTQTSAPFAYYETLGGGLGARPTANGIDGVQVHMTNTLNTPVEALEHQFPLRVHRYSLRPGSGGIGQYRGGAGLVREIEFFVPVLISLLTERRRCAPYGLAGGAAGSAGQNMLLYPDGRTEALPGKATLPLQAGTRLRIETPGGGGWGTPPDTAAHHTT